MAVKIEFVGISSGDDIDERTCVLFKIEKDNETFEWNVRISPEYVGSIQDFIDKNKDKILLDFENKINVWNNLNPKTREIDSAITGKKIVVPITKEEIVKPVYPDYYLKRKLEYPKIEDQLDAFWKGNDFIQEMSNKILNIKQKYPKE